VSEYGNKKEYFCKLLAILHLSLELRWQGVGGKCLLLGQMQQAELVAAEHWLNSFSSPCVSVKMVYNYGFWWFEHLLKEKFLEKRDYSPFSKYRSSWF
jgi:hypothetical protein